MDWRRIGVVGGSLLLEVPAKAKSYTKSFNVSPTVRSNQRLKKKKPSLWAWQPSAEVEAAAAEVEPSGV